MSKYEKSSNVYTPYQTTKISGNILNKININGVPHVSISKKQGELGRPRLVPQTFITHKEMKQLLGVKIKDMTPEQKRTYNRLAQRLEYAKTKQMEDNKETSTQYKKRINKKIKDMTDNERKTYNKLAKQEERLIKKYTQ